MAIVIRNKFVKPKTKAPCVDCNERQVGCHAKCPKYIDWRSEYQQRKKAINEHSRKIADVESYEVSQKHKVKKTKGREI